MKKYFVESTDKAWAKTFTNNASAKPRTDTYKTAVRLGYSPIQIMVYPQYLFRSVIVRRFFNVYNLVISFVQRYKLLKIKDSLVFTQYPFLNPVMPSHFRYLKRRNNRIITLLHDFSYKGIKNSGEKSMLAVSDVIVVHTQEMKEAVLKKGFKGQIVVLKFFDYLNSFSRKVNVTTVDEKVVFAGALIKSTFVYHLNDMPKEDKIKFVLYGGGWQSSGDNNGRVSYLGTFHNENISEVNGDWGLVWDGDSIDSCSGEYGHYLKINAPFKMSLYLAMGIPVIVWSESAMAKYVREYHLGIVVDRLSQISSSIRNLSDQNIKLITDSVTIYSNIVKSGGMLESALKESEKLLLQ